MKIFKRTLAPGAETVITHPGRFVRGIGGAKRYQIAVDQGQKTDFETGIAHEWPRQFTQLTVSNTADTEQTIEVAIADGFIADNRMVGRLDVDGYIQTTLEGGVTVTGGIVGTVAAGAGALSATRETITTTAKELVPANPDRRSVLISTTVPIWIGDAGVSTANGFPVTGPMTLETTAAIYAVAAESTAVYCLQEIN